MTKLKLIRLYRDNEVPDHILQEVNDLMKKMGESLAVLYADHDINIIISALNRVHAATIVAAITKEGLADAAKTEALGLIKNIEHISGLTVFEEGNG